MQPLLARLLIALSLMPSLVCAMPLCPNDAITTSTAEQPHCGGTRDKDSDQTVGAIMLFADCTNVDLQAPPAPSQLDEPALFGDLSDYGSLGLWPISFNQNSRFDAIRGPPVSRSNFSQQTPLYLKTQRVRL